MAKKKTLFVVLFLLFFILAAFTLTGRSAYADGIDLHDVDRVAVDLIAADEEGAELELTPAEDGAYEITYGAVLVLRARLDDNDAENAASFYDEVYMYYQWFYSEDGVEFAPLNDRIVGEANPSVTLTEHAQSGTYYIHVTNIQYGGSRIGFIGQSDPLKIRVLPKKLTVEYTTTRLSTTARRRTSDILSPARLPDILRGASWNTTVLRPTRVRTSCTCLPQTKTILWIPWRRNSLSPRHR